MVAELGDQLKGHGANPGRGLGGGGAGQSVNRG